MEMPVSEAPAPTAPVPETPVPVAPAPGYGVKGVAEETSILGTVMTNSGLPTTPADVEVVAPSEQVPNRDKHDNDGTRGGRRVHVVCVAGYAGGRRGGPSRRTRVDGEAC